MYSASTTCPACHTPYAANERICATCGLLFASYAPPTNSNIQSQVTTFTYVPLTPGQSLANRRFTVRQALSKGGMGAIYLASDNEAFGRMVVVKAMLDYFDPTDADAVREARARFLQEARTLSLLRHPAIPQIFTYFQDGPHNYIVMEYIEGYDLEQQLTRRDDTSGQRIDGQPYPQSDVLRWGVALCQVLVYLSSRQPHAVVHHDIKPANLLLDSSSDDIRLVDFGTAKARLLALVGSVGLQQSSVHGTQGYAAPEQYRGQSEPRSDVYALAATLYHLATDDDPRAHPFAFPQLAQLGTFGQALRPALAVDPSQRPTAAQLQRQLELLAIPTSARPLQAPDGSDLADIGALTEWCEQHWQNGAIWLYNQLPAQIELWWGQTKLAHDLHAIVKRYRQDKSAGLDAMLALLDPNDFGAQPPQIISDPPRLDFGTLTSKQQPIRTVTLSNPGRRYVQANAKLPDWVLAPRKTISLAPGEQQAIQLIVDRPQANNRRKLSEDILLQDGATTLLRVEAHATITPWRRIWQHRLLLTAVCLFALFVLWPSYVQPLAQQFQSAVAAPDPNAAHYQAAVASMKSHDWDTAIVEFGRLTGTYYDDAELLRQSYYNSAKAALDDSDWSKARPILKHIIDYSDARKLLQDSYILEAQQTGALLVLDAGAQRATFGPDDRLLLMPFSGGVFEIRHMPDGTLLRAFNGLHNSQVLDVAWSPDGQTLAFSHENGLIKFVRTDDGATLKIIEGDAGNGRVLAWSPDGQMLASGGSERVELWRADGTLRQTLLVNQPSISVRSVVFSPDGQILATGSDDGTIKLWRVADGTLLKETRQQTNAIHQMIFLDQGRTLATFDWATQLSIWRVSDGAPLNLTTLPSRVAGISAFSPDGQIIATNNPTELGQQVTLWRVADGQVLENFKMPHTGAQSLSFSPDGKQLVIVDSEGKLTLTELKVKN